MNLRLLFKILLTFLLLKSSITSLSFASNSYIVAKVGNEIITSIDVENEILTILITNKAEITQDTINQTKNIALKELIRTLIKKNEIKKFNINQYNKKDLNNYLVQIAKSLGTNKSNLKKFFEKKGISYEKFLDKYKTQFLWNTLIFQIYKNQISINTLEIENEVNQRIKNPKKLIEYDLSEIEIKNSSENQKIINDVYESIKNNGFTNAVKKYSISNSISNNGRVGVVSSNTLSKIYLEKLKNLKVGDVTKPIVNSDSIFILKINNLIKQKVENLDPEKIKDLILRKKKEEKLELFSRSHFSNLENTTLVNFL